MAVVSEVIGGAVGWQLGQKFNTRHAQRLLAQSRVECSMRLLSGDAGDLSSRWTHGRADVAAGRLTFTAYLPPGVRIRNPFRKRIVVNVLAVSPVGPRVPASWWGPGPERVTVTVRADTATIEVAVKDALAGWFVNVVVPEP
jgi:hypothetical protein